MTVCEWVCIWMYVNVCVRVCDWRPLPFCGSKWTKRKWLSGRCIPFSVMCVCMRAVSELNSKPENLYGQYPCVVLCTLVMQSAIGGQATQPNRDTLHSHSHTHTQVRHFNMNAESFSVPSFSLNFIYIFFFSFRELRFSSRISRKNGYFFFCGSLHSQFASKFNLNYR